MLGSSIKGKTTVTEATNVETLRLGVTRRGDSLHVQAFKGTRLLGESSPFLDAEGNMNPATDLEAAFGALVEADLKICVGTPKAHWKGEAYIAPRAGQADEFDAGLWYLELFGENADAAEALTSLAEIGFWEADKGVECLRFKSDPSRETCGRPLAERIAAAEALSSARAETRTSGRRMRY